MTNLKISVRLDANGRAYVSALDAAGKSTKDFKQEVREVKPAVDQMRESVSSLRGTIQALGLGLAAREAIQFADAYSKLTSQLRFATESTGSMAQAQDDVRRIAAEARTQIDGVATLYSRLKVAGDDLGASQKTVALVTENVAKGLRLFGATSEEAASVMTQFSQALNKGKLDGDEFKSVLENAPIITKALTQELGVTKGALFDMSEQGKLSAQTLLDALSDPDFTKELNRQFGEVPATFTDAMQAITNVAEVTFGEFNRGGQFSQSLFEFADVGEESMKRIGDAAFAEGANIRAAFAGLRGVFLPLIDEAQFVWNKIKSLGGGNFSSDILQNTFREVDTTYNAAVRPGSILDRITGRSSLERRYVSSRDNTRRRIAGEERDRQLADMFGGTEKTLDFYRGGAGAAADALSGGGSSSKGTKKGKSGGGSVSKAAREAAKELRELNADLKSVTGSFDPAAAAANKYADNLAKIEKLKKAGKISDGEAALYGVNAGKDYQDSETKRIRQETQDFYKNLGIDVQGDFDEVVNRSVNRWENGLSEGAKKMGPILEDQSLTAAQAFAQVVGGKLGGTVSQILGVIQGAQTGNYNSVGGKLGGLMTLLSGKPGPDGQSTGFGAGVKEFSQDLKKTFKGIFGESGPFSGAMGKTLGKAFAGAQFGGAIGKGVTNALGIKGSKTGAQVGGAIGQAFGGPIGAAIGGTLGSIVGGLFKKSKTGSTSIGFVDGALGLGSTTGNSQAFKDQSKGLAQSIMGNLTTLADQLGAVITGAPTVSVGIRNGKPVVDTTGKNRTKGAGVVKFKKGEEEAAAAFAQKEALKDLISDGFIQGLSAKVKAALQSNDDLDKAFREALKVDEIERLLDGFGGAAKKAFVDFERQAKERLRIAGKYGFDLVKLEELNAKERTKLFESAVDSAVGSLKTLLEDLTTGERAPGTLLDRREALIAKRDKLLANAATDADVANKLADVLNQLDQINLEAFGTAGAQFASDRAGIKSTAQAIIEQATADLKAAQDKAMANAGTAADATAKAIAEANAGVVGALDENNAQNAQIIAALNKLNMSAITSIGGGGASPIVAALNIGLNYK